MFNKDNKSFESKRDDLHGLVLLEVDMFGGSGRFIKRIVKVFYPHTPVAMYIIPGNLTNLAFRLCFENYTIVHANFIVSSIGINSCDDCFHLLILVVFIPKEIVASSTNPREKEFALFL